MFVVQENIGNSEGVVKTAFADPLPSGDNRNALFPDEAALGQPIEWGVVFSSRWHPTICAADKSTKSQLLIYAVLDK